MRLSTVVNQKSELDQESANQEYKSKGLAESLTSLRAFQIGGQIVY